MEKFSIGGSKPKTKVIITTNNNGVLHRYQPKRFEKKYRQNAKIEGKRPGKILFRLASDLFRTLSEFLDQSHTELKKTKAVRDYSLHSVKNFSISTFQSNHENSITIQRLKLIQNEKPATPKKLCFI